MQCIELHMNTVALSIKINFITYLLPQYQLTQSFPRSQNLMSQSLMKTYIVLYHIYIIFLTS
jgi:hypothetical protein